MMSVWKVRILSNVGIFSDICSINRIYKEYYWDEQVSPTNIHGMQNNSCI